MADRRRSAPGPTRGTPPRRPAARPAQRGVSGRPRGAAERGGGSTAGPAAPARSRLTGRAAILILLVAVLAVSYASSMRAYLQQRSHISDLKAEIAQRSSNIDELEREKKRWKDDAFLEQQARQRLDFVFPGETSYQVLDESGKPLGSQDTLHDAAEVVKVAPTAWWDTAWQSVELAGHPPRAPAGPDTPQR